MNWGGVLYLTDTEYYRNTLRIRRKIQMRITYGAKIADTMEYFFTYFQRTNVFEIFLLSTTSN